MGGVFYQTHAWYAGFKMDITIFFYKRDRTFIDKNV
jgi:hypothetical protein